MCLIIGCYVMVSAPCPPIECPVLCVYICHQRGGVSEGVKTRLSAERMCMKVCKHSKEDGVINGVYVRVGDAPVMPM